MEILFYPMNLFIAHPVMALLPALVSGAVYAALYRTPGAGPRRFALTAAMVWALYTVYEWRMSIWEKTVATPIRVDLLLSAPMLYLVTIIGVTATVIGFLRTARMDAWVPWSVLPN